MAWQNGDRLPSGADRIRWARKTYEKYDRPELERRRLVLLINLVTLDSMLQQMEGAVPILSPMQVTEWLELYETHRPTQPIGRPKTSSESDTGPT